MKIDKEFNKEIVKCNIEKTPLTDEQVEKIKTFGDIEMPDTPFFVKPLSYELYAYAVVSTENEECIHSGVALGNIDLTQIVKDNEKVYIYLYNCKKMTRSSVLKVSKKVSIFFVWLIVFIAFSAILTILNNSNSLYILMDSLGIGTPGSADFSMFYGIFAGIRYIIIYGLAIFIAKF